MTPTKPKAFLLCLAATLIMVSACSKQDIKKSENWTEVHLGMQEPPHDKSEDEIWCYRTIGSPDCYPSAQPGMEGRLIGVNPPYKYPSTPEAYRKMQDQQ